jgi:DNA-binding transcriptional LysR family regulator
MWNMNLYDLDIRQMDAFAAVMSAGSITGAARLLGRSQPQVTRMIQDLETSLGYELFHRSGPRISPTENGVLFNEEVERLLIGLNHVRERAIAIGRRDLRPMEIAATSALAIGLLPTALAALTPSLMPHRLHVQSLSPENVVQAILSRSADYGLSSLPIDHPGLDIHWIGEAPCVVAISSRDPLSDHACVDIAAIGQRRVIIMANPYRLRRRIDDVFLSAGLELRDVIDTNTSSTALAMVRAGLGVAIVEPATACGLRPEGIVFRPINVSIPFYFGAISPSSKPLSPTVLALDDALRAAAVDLMAGCRLHDGSYRELLDDALYGAAPATNGEKGAVRA